MIKITDEQKELLLKHLPDADIFIESDDIDNLLDELDNKITEIGFNSDYSLNETGLKLQLLYDQIYNQN